MKPSGRTRLRPGADAAGRKRHKPANRQPCRPSRNGKRSGAHVQEEGIDHASPSESRSSQDPPTSALCTKASQIDDVVEVSAASARMSVPGGRGRRRVVEGRAMT